MTVAEPHPEQGTIEAIQQLQSAYPFATTLLIYCLIERRVKYLVIEERKQPHAVLLDARWHGELRRQSDTEFIASLTSGWMGLGFIARRFADATHKATLGTIAQRRNTYMHANDLFPPVVELDREQRSQLHKTELRQAIQDLQRTLDILQDPYHVTIDHAGKIRDFHPRGPMSYRRLSRTLRPRRHDPPAS